MSMNFFEEVDLGAGDVKVGTRCFLFLIAFLLSVGLTVCLSVHLVIVCKSI